MTSPDGALPIQQTEVQVRTTFFVSNVGVFLTVGAGLFLAGWWAHDIRRRRRRRAGHPGAPGAVFAAGGDPRHRSELRAVSDAVGAAGQRSTSLLRSSAIVGLGTALSRITGFLRVAAIAYAIGAGALAGTYSYANETPNMLYELLLGGCSRQRSSPSSSAMSSARTTRRSAPS